MLTFFSCLSDEMSAVDYSISRPEQTNAPPFRTPTILVLCRRELATFACVLVLTSVLISKKRNILPGLKFSKIITDQLVKPALRIYPMGKNRVTLRSGSGYDLREVIAAPYRSTMQGFRKYQRALVP